MPPRIRKKLKTRSSKLFCQEKFCCSVINAEAVWFCEECTSNQCCDCDSEIHDSNIQALIKYNFHERRLIDLPVTEDLCQLHLVKEKKTKVCKLANFSDIRCHNCELNFCFECDNIVHGGKRQNHKRVPIKDLQKIKLTVPDEIIRVSHEDSDDDNLTYVSLPSLQDDEPLEDTSQIMSYKQKNSIPDICSSNNLDSPCLVKQQKECTVMEDDPYMDCHSVCLADEQEVLKVLDEDDFISKLGCREDERLKVVSIFGNTGDGKSHTLNFTFFGGKEIFRTSSQQESCTIGVSVAYDPLNYALIIDTEGLLGIASNENQRTRLLLKVMAISDVVVYRTRAERLHNDLFYFLGNASKAYLEHFRQELEAATKRLQMKLTVSNLGPAVIVFHETMYTDVLDEEAERTIRQRFHDLDCSIDAFSDLLYIGTRTDHPPTDFNCLYNCVKSLLKNNSIRTSRTPRVIYHTLKVLNDKFSGDIDKPVPDSFPDQYFTCTATCLSCGGRCSSSINHSSDEVDHEIDPPVRCKYQHQYGNKIYLCKVCYLQGKSNVIVPKTSASCDSSWVGFAKYIWSGYVLECPNCGIVYRSHQYWYGNQEVESAVHVEVRHVWCSTDTTLEGTHNAARKVLDSLNLIADTVSIVSAKPTKIISDWMADQIAPSYWVPNYQITTCTECDTTFEHVDQKHHCRACGRGFCAGCSEYERPVPERGWGEAPVRVCYGCYNNLSQTDSDSITTCGGETQLTARRVGEAVTSTLGAVASVIDYPLGVLKESARPAYWVPDDQITQCVVCHADFSPKLPIHHCRGCGHGVCEACSPARKVVVSRGWDYPVRVCTRCEKRRDSLKAASS